MARLAGFEPATYGLEVRCSIQLSYRRIFFNQLFANIKIGPIFYYIHKKKNYLIYIDPQSLLTCPLHFYQYES